jgi:hypothetical protein
MAVRNTKNSLAATNEYKVDLSFMNKSRVRSALVKLGNLLRLGWLSNNDLDAAKFDVENARELQMANYNNVSDMAHLYSRKY